MLQYFDERRMELSALVEPTDFLGYRASSGEPIPALAEVATRDEALHSLRIVIENRIRSGTEMVRMQVGRTIPSQPIWPDDAITNDWLEGIAEAKKNAYSLSNQTESIGP